MKKLLNTAKRFMTSEDGPTATEYAVMLSLIIVVCIGTVALLGQEIDKLFGSVSTALNP